MTVSIKCAVCENWFNTQESYDSHTPCNNTPMGASGDPKSFVDKYAKKGTGRP